MKNLELLPESLKAESLKDSLIDFLKHHFSRENHCHALLILDDVCDSKIIETFNFECKTLVITADLDVVWAKRPFVIKVLCYFFVYFLLCDTHISNIFY